MTSLCFAGTLFSGWQQLAKELLPANTISLSTCERLSAFSRKLCAQHFPVTDELSWRTISPDDKHIEAARQLINTTIEKPVFGWADTNSSLLLNFWHSVFPDTRFVLLYSSPEYELSKYINTHPFDTVTTTKVIEAWLIRTRAMLTFFMRNRSESLFLNMQSAQAQSSILNQSINENFGLDLDLDIKLALNGDDRQDDNSALLEYLASTLLLDNEVVAEIYDEVRSVATVVCDQDKTITQIQTRNSALTDYLKDSPLLKVARLVRRKQ